MVLEGSLSGHCDRSSHSEDCFWVIDPKIYDRILLQGDRMEKCYVKHNQKTLCRSDNSPDYTVGG